MDEAVLRAINSLAEIPFIATLATLLSSRWLIPCVCGPVAYLLIKQKRWAAMLSIALAMGAADAVNSRVLKPLVDRQRPCRALAGLVQPVSCGVGGSFPSTHAANSFAFLLSAAPVLRYGWAIVTPIALGVSSSRVVLGVHYPTDVAGGAVIGSIFGAFGWLGRRKWEAGAKRSSRSPSTSP